MEERIDVMDAPKQGDTEMGKQDPDFLLVEKLKREGTEWAKKIKDKWPTYRKFYKGDQYDSKRPSAKMSEVYNICREVIQSILPIWTDSKPGFNVGPRKPKDYVFATKLSKLVESLWKRLSMQMRMAETIQEAMTVGTGVMSILWNNDLDNGNGDVDIEVIDPDNIIVPDGSLDFDRNCPWVIEKKRKRVSELKLKFPDKAHLIKADDVGEDEENPDPQDAKVQSDVDKRDKSDDYSGYGKKVDTGTAEVNLCWIDAQYVDEYEETEEEDENGETKTVTKKKYPNGKLIITLPKVGIRLESVNNPYNDATNPYVRFIDSQVPHQFYGEGEIEPLMGIQKMMNKTLSTIMDYMNMTGNPVWKIPREASVDPTRISNAMGLILYYSGTRSPERDIPPALPSYYFNILTTLGRFKDNVSGVQDVTQGRKPVGVTAAEAIQTLDEAAQTRIRLKERYMTDSLNQMAVKVIARMLQFYKNTRVEKITGDGQWPKYVEFSFKDHPQGTVMQAVDYVYDTEQSKYVPSNSAIETEPTDGIFDVEVLAGTAAPQKKSQMASLAFRLFDSGVIGGESLMDQIEWPNKDEDKRILKEKEEAAKQAAATQGQPL